MSYKTQRICTPPQCITAWTLQNRSYTVSPQTPNHNAWLKPKPKSLLVPDDKSVSTTNTQTDVIDSLQHKLNCLEQQLQKLQQSAHQQQVPSSPLEGSLQRLEHQFLDIIEAQQQTFELQNKAHSQELAQFQTIANSIQENTATLCKNLTTTLHNHLQEALQTQMNQQAKLLYRLYLLGCMDLPTLQLHMSF